MAPVFDVPVRGPAHSRAQRWVASALVIAALAGLVRMALALPDGAQGGTPWVMLVAAVALAGPYFFLMTATTTVDAEGIAQSGLMSRRVRWDDVAAAHVGGPLFARCLRVRTIGGAHLAFRGSGDALRAAFERVAAAYAGRA